MGPRKYELNHSLSRTLAALLGTLPVALGLGLALTFALPLPITERYLIGSYSVFPLWVTASACTFLAPSGKRAWLWLGLLLVLALGLVGLGGLLGQGGLPGGVS